MRDMSALFRLLKKYLGLSQMRIGTAVGTVLSRAQEAGVVRQDLDQADLMQLVGGMCMARNATLEQNQRLLTFLLDGLKPQG